MATNRKTKSVAVQMTHRELSTVLAALRFWQRKVSETNQTELVIARDGGRIAHCLSNAEIDTLCIGISTGERYVIPMPGCLTANLTSAQDLDLLNRAARYQEAFDGSK
jgi:hypothetical protein